MLQKISISNKCRSYERSIHTTVSNIDSKNFWLEKDWRVMAAENLYYFINIKIVEYEKYTTLDTKSHSDFSRMHQFSELAF